ncbi:hypothetical protein HC028_14480 [Planosporangium flavigriseum]|nr:hypothetical protein [Planosporangium flavigriseum]NJC65696.1 hypothetical protein [Planosporangium flavigriseum]
MQSMIAASTGPRSDLKPTPVTDLVSTAGVVVMQISLSLDGESLRSTGLLCEAFQLPAPETRITHGDIREITAREANWPVQVYPAGGDGTGLLTVRPEEVLNP